MNRAKCGITRLHGLYIAMSSSDDDAHMPGQYEGPSQGPLKALAPVQEGRRHATGN
jgi:hypothetical protein